jgi:membrane-associated phospholipid phosphatase
LVAGTALIAGSLVEVRRPGIRPWEQAAFRLANQAPDQWRAPVRIVMQAGTFGTVPASAAVAALAGRRWLALRLLAGGLMAWFGAKAIKPLGGRQRPEHVVEGARIREGIAGNLGWVSGHSAVATTLAATAADELPGWALPLLVGVVATTGFGRIYVGAHLPHDVIGGIGLGMVIFALLPPDAGRRVVSSEPGLQRREEQRD